MILRITKVSDPLLGKSTSQNKNDANEIWKALKNGVIDMIATDHAPHTAAEKMKESIWEADCGFPGVETQMPLMLTAVNQGKITLEHYVKISSENPARAFGLWPHKGNISVGAHADITVIDIHRKETIKAANLHSRGKITPFENFETIAHRCTRSYADDLLKKIERSVRI